MRTENRRVKYLTLLALLVGSGLGLLSATQTWVTIQVRDVANHAGTVTVAGSAAAPALTALSLAGLALTAALAIAGPAFRVVLALLGVLLGVSLVYSALAGRGDPLPAARAAITSATGVAGEASLRKLVQSTTTAFWPWLAVVGGVLVALSGVLALVFVGAGPRPARPSPAPVAGPARRASTRPGSRARTAARPRRLSPDCTAPPRRRRRAGRSPGRATSARLARLPNPARRRSPPPSTATPRSTAGTN